MSMPFWPIVIAALVGVPFILFLTGMGMIFAAAGLAGGPQASRAGTVVYGWLAIAWVLVSVFGAFGLVPAWRAWHGGAEDFVGSLSTFVDWLAGAGALGVLAAVAVGAITAMDGGRVRQSRLMGVARWLLLALGLAPWAAVIAWVAWPLVLWPRRGSFQWPDAATGWTHTAEVAVLLVAATLVEEAVRRLRKR
jgi:hypothetical protein